MRSFADGRRNAGALDEPRGEATNPTANTAIIKTAPRDSFEEISIYRQVNGLCVRSSNCTCLILVEDSVCFLLSSFALLPHANDVGTRPPSRR